MSAVYYLDIIGNRVNLCQVTIFICKPTHHSVSFLTLQLLASTTTEQCQHKMPVYELY